MEDPNQAIEWLMQLISVVPTDSQALSKLGELYDSEGDKSQAFQYYYEVGVLSHVPSAFWHFVDLKGTEPKILDRLTRLKLMIC